MSVLPWLRYETEAKHFSLLCTSPYTGLQQDTKFRAWTDSVKTMYSRQILHYPVACCTKQKFKFANNQSHIISAVNEQPLLREHQLNPANFPSKMSTQTRIFLTPELDDFTRILFCVACRNTAANHTNPSLQNCNPKYNNLNASLTNRSIISCC